jgi:hypothetical protein
VPLQGSIENGRVQAVYRKETIRTAQVDTRALYYSLNLLPPSFLKLRQNIRETFTALPRFDAGTRLIWFNTLAKLGSHIIIGAEFGGTAHMDSVIDTVEVRLSFSLLRRQILISLWSSLVHVVSLGLKRNLLSNLPPSLRRTWANGRRLSRTWTLCSLTMRSPTLPTKVEIRPFPPMTKKRGWTLSHLISFLYAIALSPWRTFSLRAHVCMRI